MKISIFGLGYVGAVTAGCLARNGHQIVGVDIHSQKVEAFNEGLSPIIEPELDELLTTAKLKGLLRATTDTAEALEQTELSIVCVGTPSASSGVLDLSFVRQLTKEIAENLRRRPKRHALVFRSTMLPGSTESLVKSELSGLGDSVQVLYFPEFLREGTAVADFFDPSLVVLGINEGDKPGEEILKLLGSTAADVVSWRTAEMVKYACNAFHATKIAFANEIGRISKSLSIDSAKVMSLLCQDKRLNISPYYLRPGNPFGGSCLPKDVRALVHCARQAGVNVPVIENLLPSNEQQLRVLIEFIKSRGERKVTILGLTFKHNTDDLRESAMVEVAQDLLGRGYDVRIYDPQINMARLIGRNKTLIDTKMPHLSSLLRDKLSDAVDSEGIIVAAQKCVSLDALSHIVTERHLIVDINGWAELRQLPCRYEGFCW